MLAIMTMLVLVCGGGGTAVKPDVRSVDGSANFSGQYNYGQGNFSGSSDYSGTVYGTRERGYTDQVDVEIGDDSGRIRLPRVTLPIIRGGEGGWFELKNLSITDRAIDGNAAINIINKPKVHIDRVTGTISITGKNGDFNGQCRRVETEAQKQF